MFLYNDLRSRRSAAFSASSANLSTNFYLSLSFVLLLYLVRNTMFENNLSVVAILPGLTCLFSSSFLSYQRSFSTFHL